MIITYQTDRASVVFDASARKIIITDVAGLATDVQLQTTEGPARMGAAISGQRVQPKTVTLSGMILQDLELHRQRLLAVVAPLVHARLIFDLGPQGCWYLDGYPTSCPTMGDGSAYQPFQFKFFAPYPYFRALETKNYLLTGLVAMWKTPMMLSGTHWISRADASRPVQIANAGDVPQPFVVNLQATAQVTNPCIVNVDTGQRIAVKKVMAAGDKLRISTADADRDAGTAIQYTSADGTVTNGFRYIQPGSALGMQIAPGGTAVQATAEKGAEQLTAVLTAAGGERHSI